MFKFGARSLRNLEEVHPLLANGCHNAIRISPVDFAIICGRRGESVQNDYYARGLSKVQFPDSQHNKSPSMALDFAPWPIDWNDSLAFARVAGIIQACVHDIIRTSTMVDWKKLTTRWGGDWDRDGSSRDQSFMDIGHLEIRLL